jgi:hypothetical protein
MRVLSRFVLSRSSSRAYALISVVGDYRNIHGTIVSRGSADDCDESVERLECLLEARLEVLTVQSHPAYPSRRRHIGNHAASQLQPCTCLTLHISRETYRAHKQNSALVYA